MYALKSWISYEKKAGSTDRKIFFAPQAAAKPKKEKKPKAAAPKDEALADPVAEKLRQQRCGPSRLLVTSTVGFLGFSTTCFMVQGRLFMPEFSKRTSFESVTFKAGFGFGRGLT